MHEHDESPKSREAIVAGIFYPEDPVQLSKAVDEYVSGSGDKPPQAAAIIVPHAGFAYSGKLAGLAWAATVGLSVDTVVIISPYHRGEEPFVFLPESEFFNTPLGKIRVDLDLASEMLDCGTLFRINDLPHLEEHGIEIQLPFMSRIFPDASLLPIILAANGTAAARALGSALDIILADRVDRCLIVVSSDASFGTDPLRTAELADAFTTAVLARDTKALGELGAEKGSACGIYCASALLSSKVTQGLTPILLGRGDSSELRENTEERLVHYSSFALCRQAL